MNESQQTPFQPFDEMGFSNDQCFLCGVKLTSTNRTEEHIFPEWLLHKFDLWDQTITLLNRTSISYRNLRIPCCSVCNNQSLSELEKEVKSAVENGSGEVRNLNKLRLYQWMGKIFFGLLYRELSLAVDRSQPELGSITTPEFIQDYRALHGFLQSIIKPVEFQGFFPGSIFVLELEQVAELGDFDYSDSFNGMAFCIRMGNVGIIACLKDDGHVQESLFELYEAMKDAKITPMQFDEFCAWVFYSAFLIVRNETYVSLTSKDNHSTIIQAPRMSVMPKFDEWDNKMFAYFLEEFLSKYGITFDEIFVEPNSIRSTLGDFM